MKRIILLAIISLPAICSAQNRVNEPALTSERLFKVTQLGSTVRVWTQSDELYLRIMREYRMYVRSVYMRPNLWGKTGEYTDYTLLFPREFKPRIKDFLKKFTYESRFISQEKE